MNTENEANINAVVITQMDDDMIAEERKRSVSLENCSDNSDCSRIGGNRTMEQHFSGIEKMVHELKQGFVDVMEALSAMQDGDTAVKQELTDIANTLEIVKTDQEDVRHRQVTDEETSTKNMSDIKSLKSEVSNLSSQLTASLQTQEHLQQKVNILQAERNLLVEELFRSGAISERVKHKLSDNKLSETSSTWPGHDSDSFLNHSTEQMRHREHAGNAVDSGIEDGVTASACKCLSLLQALEEKCRLPDLPDSIDEDAFQQWSQSLDSGMYKDDKSSSQQRFPSPNSNQTEQQHADAAERQEAVQAIIDSEKEYVGKLWSLLDGYLGPLQDGHVISSRELSLLLPPYLQQMYDQHCQILHLLQERLLHWNWSGIVGDVLARVTDTQKDSLMNLYKNYLADFPGIISCLKRQLSQSRKFRIFIKEEANSEGIVSLLTAPIRRIPRYSLLLQQLLKHTPTVHPDHYILQSSLCTLQSFVDKFSEQIKQTLCTDKDNRNGALSFRSSPSGSSCDAVILPCSARESILHEENNPELKRVFPDSRENYLPQWIESSISERQEYQDSRIASLSQPDLAYGRFTAPLECQNQIYTAHRGPPIIVDKPSNHRKYRIKKRQDRSVVASHQNFRPSGHANLPPGYGISYSAASLINRPASAVDFMPTYDIPALRPAQNHIFRRPQSAMGGLLFNDTRNKSLHNQLLNRKYSDGFSNSHDMFPGSQSSHSVTPSPRDSPGILVNGNIEDIREYCEHPGSLFRNNEDVTRADSSLAYGFDSYRESEIENVEELKLAASLAESFQHDDDLDDSVVLHVSEHSHPNVNGPCKNVSNENREYLQNTNRDHLCEAGGNNSKGQISELRLDIKNSDDNEDSISGGKHSMHSDSTYLPNSTFEESMRSDLNNSGNQPGQDRRLNDNGNRRFTENDQKHSCDNLVLQTRKQQNNSSQVNEMNSQIKEQSVNPSNSVNVVTTNGGVSVTNGKMCQDDIVRSQPVTLPVTHLRDFESKKGKDTSVLSSDESLLKTSPKSDMNSSLEKIMFDQDFNPCTQPKAKVRQTFTNSAEIQNSLMKNDDKKKKKDGKRYNSLENLSKSSEDVGKKSTLKSLKHFFGKKNGLLANLPLSKVHHHSHPEQGSVRLDQLEAAYFKQHGYTNQACDKACIVKGDQISLENSANNNNRTKEPVMKGDQIYGNSDCKTSRPNELTHQVDNCGTEKQVTNNASVGNVTYVGDSSMKNEQMNAFSRKKKSPLFFLFRDLDGQNSSNV